VAVPPILRAEGLTEQIGDIVIQCTGGVPTPLGSPVPTANFTVSLGTNVTSRLIGAGTATNPGNSSEALLFIDEPTSGGFGPGPALPANVCSNSAVGAGFGGCATVAGTITPTVLSGTTTAACSVTSNGVCTAGVTSVPNVFQGLVSGNQVTFNGVPILAPVTGGFTRIFRITNVRANVAGLGGGGLPGTTQLLASVSISGSTALPINNPVQIAGFIQSGLSTTVRNSANSSGNTRTFLQCTNTGTSSTAGPAPGALLEFKENFATAFKTRIAATASANGGGIGSTTFFQSTPGTIYNSESGLIMNVNGATAGLADFGTRLKATFNNIPAGVRIFVTTFNLANLNANLANNENTLSGANLVNGAVSPTLAVLVPSETGTNFAGATPPSTTFSTPGAGVLFTELAIVNGSATAVWEVLQANPAAIDTVQFGVNFTIVGNQANNTPPAGSGTVNLSFAPTAGPFTFSASSGAASSGSLPIPRFVDNSSASTIVTIQLCQTQLLFPFVTNINGFDTGLAIANTTTDTSNGITPQNGTCTLNFYGSTAPSAFNTGNVASGTVYANTASTVAPGFQGYIIAVCNFQLAHGFAFVSDVGARNLAMGYLALIINNGSLSRSNAPSAENLNN